MEPARLQAQNSFGLLIVPAPVWTLLDGRYMETNTPSRGVTLSLAVASPVKRVAFSCAVNIIPPGFSQLHPILPASRYRTVFPDLDYPAVTVVLRYGTVSAASSHQARRLGGSWWHVFNKQIIHPQCLTDMLFIRHITMYVSDWYGNKYTLLLLSRIRNIVVFSLTRHTCVPSCDMIFAELTYI
jgi:hypothetical protein